MESERIELQKSLVNEISKGMGQVKQLKVSCSEQERVVERMLSSYEEALFILTGRAPQGQCQSVITSSSNPKPPTGTSPSAHKGGSRSAQKRRRAIQRLVNVKAADDVYSWRKYGEKPILNSIYPRSYYRCQAKSCEAKKQVQRSGNDPSTFHVTYTGVHTCQPNSPSSNMGNIEQDQENFNFPPEAFGDPVMSLNAIVADLELDQLMGDLPMNF